MGAVGGLKGRSAIQRDHDGLHPPRADTQRLEKAHCSLRADWEAAFWKWVMVNKKLELKASCVVLPK